MEDEYEQMRELVEDAVESAIDVAETNVSYDIDDFWILVRKNLNETLAIFAEQHDVDTGTWDW